MVAGFALAILIGTRTLAAWRALMIGTDYPFPWNKVPVDDVPFDPGAKRR